LLVNVSKLSFWRRSSPTSEHNTAVCLAFHVRSPRCGWNCRRNFHAAENSAKMAHCLSLCSLTDSCGSWLPAITDDRKK